MECQKYIIYKCVLSIIKILQIKKLFFNILVNLSIRLFRYISSRNQYYHKRLIIFKINV